MALGSQQISQAKQSAELRRILRQPTVSHLLQSQSVLDNVKRILSLGTYPRLELFELLGNTTQGRIRQRPALARAQRHLPAGMTFQVLRRLAAP